jgi:hypothetical protein
MSPECGGDVPPAIEELEIVEAATGIPRERTHREAGMHARDVAGQAPYERAREERLEGLSHASLW